MSPIDLGLGIDICLCQQHIAVGGGGNGGGPDIPELTNVAWWFRATDLDTVNLLVRTEALEDTIFWTRYFSVPVTTGITDPDGDPRAISLGPGGEAINARIRQAPTDAVTGGESVVGSVWAKQAAGHNGTSKFRIEIWDGIESHILDQLPTASWARYDYPITFNVSANQIRFELYPDHDLGTEIVEFWHPQVEFGASVSSWEFGGVNGAGNVVEWRDRSGNFNHAAMVTDANRPTVVQDYFDGSPAALYDGVNDHHVAAFDINMPASAHHEIWVVFEAALATGEEFIIGDNSGGWDALQIYTPSAVMRRELAGTRKLSGGGQDWTNVDLWRAERIAAGTHTFYKNGTVSGTPAALAQNAIHRRIAKGGLTAGNYAYMHLLEMIVIDGTLPGTEEDDLYAYIGEKYPTIGLA